MTFQSKENCFWNPEIGKFDMKLERTKPLKVLSPSPPLKKGTTGDCPLFIPGKKL
jgi:hypothetical protein